MAANTYLMTTMCHSSKCLTDIIPHNNLIKCLFNGWGNKMRHDKSLAQVKASNKC